MLCVPVKTDTELETLLTNNDWVMQQKLDGERRLTVVDDGAITVYNRKGDVISRINGVLGMAPSFEDSEIIGGVEHIFDFGIVGVDQSLSERLKHVNGVTTFYGDEKLKFLELFREQKVEGVVFKRLQSRYEPGKRSQNWRKYKFTDTVDCIVMGVGRRGPLSVDIAVVRHDNQLIDVGSVKTQPEVLPHLNIGTVVEVKYLYATDSNKLYQPVWGCVRTDKSPRECTVDQLKYSNKKVF